ncbi:hypothetical protein FRC06_007758 [Ceratobasidium sp. 370]|nr:hypothetical protein FRC06_007758 [Ceratobasidium sp. 370]
MFQELVYAHSMSTARVWISHGDALVRISAEIWSDIVDDVKNVEITLEGDDVGAGNQGESASTLYASTAQTAQDTHLETSLPRDTGELDNGLTSSCDSFAIPVRAASEQYLELGDLASLSKVGDIKYLIETRSHVPAALQKLELLGERLKVVRREKTELKHLRLEGGERIT